MYYLIYPDIMVANTTLVNTHLLTFLKEVLIENLIGLFPSLIVIVGIISLTILGVVRTNKEIHINHINACEKLSGDNLKAYVYGMTHLDKVTCKTTFTHTQGVKQPELPKP
ncbi:hypothetical protein JZN54_004023 [Vibrio vulnificus]|nr:hypothetical protein [Vibrio vulnificus]